MIKNTLYSSGQTVTLATGQSYTLKDNEVMINTVIYRKADIEITLENNGVISDSKDVKVGIRKRDGVSGMPAHYENYDKWYIDGTQQTTLSNCVENINTAIYYTASSGGGVDEHIKDYPVNSTDLKDKNFYYKDNYTTEDLPEGIYAAISTTNKNRVIQDLGLNTVQSGNNIFNVICSIADTFLIQSENVTESSIVINLTKKVKGKTISLLVNPQDKTLILDEIPADQLTDLKPNEWNIIYIHCLGNFQKNDLGLGTSGTVNLYNVQIKQPVIV